MNRLVWLASFPKSGSTWLRTALHGLVHGPLARSADLAMTMPSLHGADMRYALGAVEHGGIVLSHKAAGPHTARYPLGAALIRLVRHPADVLLSEARFFALTQLDGKLAADGRDRATAADLNELISVYLRIVLAQGAPPERHRQGIGSWAENVESWAAVADGRPGLLLRYEDLKADPAGELGRVATLLGLPATGPAVDRAVEVSALGTMRALQEREIRDRVPGRYYQPRHEKAYAAGLRFVSQGQVGQGLRLPEPALRALDARWGAVAARFGYALAPDQPAVVPLPAALRQVRPLAVGAPAASDR